MEIVQRHDPILRAQAAEVPLADISTPRIKNVIADMKRILATQHDGVAIAAPQIGHSLRIFVVSKKVFALEEDNEDTAQYEDLTFINPTITRMSKKMKAVDEGCLSVRYLYGKVMRAEKATVVAYDEHGKKFTRHGSGLLAQVFQHETDHLDGTLFIDKATDLQEIPPEDSAH